MDEIATENVLKFESDLYTALDDEKTILEDITKNKAMSEDSEKKLKEVIEKVVELNK